ncbi:hypothetical protein PV08_01856 [Exophiala spinifera]|uniref:Uncharacterized protein n=1 Tax=Exophiala spinifera TaxID=91928 RepID=A0A0D1Z0W0_9EURO|nr:uncharacterized protein PV08_01856 [Exophiala spinifera]KIW21276.1 hypothetical protein PV08_01856 [Exophiala spinifera]
MVLATVSTLPPASAGLDPSETDPDKIESFEGIVNGTERTVSFFQSGPDSPTDNSTSDLPTAISHSKVANPREHIILEGQSTQPDGKLQRCSPLFTMERSEIGIGMDLNAANTGDGPSRIRQDLQQGRFEIPPLKNQNFDFNAPPTGTHQSPSTPRQLYLSPLRRRFDMSHLLPDRNLPFNLQIMEHVKSWAELGTRIEDDTRRKEVLDHVFEVLQKAWFEALRLGYDPGTPIPESGKRRQRMSVAPTLVKSQHNLHLPPPIARPRQRKDVEPSKLPIFVSGSYKNSQLWGVTAGELEQAGVSENRVRERAIADLSSGDELLQEVLEDLDTEEISKTDWLRTEEVTPLNPLGRNILLYTLFEVQMSRRSLDHLQSLYAQFTTKQQKANTQKRIDEEMKRHNLFLALALEVTDHPGTSSSGSPESEHEGESHLDKQFPDSGVGYSAAGDPLIEAVEKVVALASTPELGQLVCSMSVVLPEHVLDTANTANTDTLSDKERARCALREILQDIQSIQALSSDAEDTAANSKRHLYLQTEIAELEKNVSNNKKLLADLLPGLKDSLPRVDEESHVPVDIEMGGLQDNAEHSLSGEAATRSEPNSGTSLETTSSAGAPTSVQDLEDVDADLMEHPQLGQAKHDHATIVEPCPSALTRTGSSEQNTSSAIPDSSLEAQPVERYSRVPSQGHEESAHVVQERALGQSLVVRMLVCKGFDPTEFTSEKVFEHGGFSYRYTRASSLSERRAMDEYLDSYIRRHRKSPTHGHYDALCHPADPERRTVVHGIWNNKSGGKADGSEWFYDGDGDCQPPAVEYNHKRSAVKSRAEAETASGEEGASDVVEGRPGTLPEREPPRLVNKNFKNVLKIKLKTRPDANIGKRRQMQNNKRRSRAGPLPASPLSRSMTASTTRPPKRARSASAGRRRSKRHAGKQATSTEVDGNTDDEYVPSD